MNFNEVQELIKLISGHYSSSEFALKNVCTHATRTFYEAIHPRYATIYGIRNPFVAAH